MNNLNYIIDCFNHLINQEMCYSVSSVEFNSKYWNGFSHPSSNVSLFDYHFNSHGFHGDEFYRNPDTLALGCSVTAGQGLPHEFTWSNIIKSYTQSSINTCAYSAASVQKIWHNCLIHMSFFGRPKNVMFLIPNMERITYPSPYNSWEDLDYAYSIESFVSGGGKPFFSKNYDGKRSTVPFEISIEQFSLTLMQMAYMSEIMDINFSLFSWNKYTIDLLNELKSKNNSLSKIVIDLPDGFLDLKRKAFIPNCKGEDCMFNAIPVTGLAKELWEEANDRPSGHPGLHAHLHWAEIMGNITLDEEFILNIKIGER